MSDKRYNYIMMYASDGLPTLRGPYITAAAATEAGREWQHVNHDNPCWTTLMLTDDESALWPGNARLGDGVHTPDWVKQLEEELK